MNNLKINIDEEKLAELERTTGRVNNFTFHYFFAWFWVCTLVFIVVFSFFVCAYRRLRGD